jgi:hypothetical protein
VSNQKNQLNKEARGVANKTGKTVWLADDVLGSLAAEGWTGGEVNTTLRNVMGLDHPDPVVRSSGRKKKRSGKHGRPFKYDVTDLDVGESKTLYDVHPEMALPCIHRYGRTRGKVFMCQGAPGCITVTRVK